MEAGLKFISTWTLLYKLRIKYITRNHGCDQSSHRNVLQNTYFANKKFHYCFFESSSLLIVLTSGLRSLLGQVLVFFLLEVLLSVTPQAGGQGTVASRAAWLCGGPHAADFVAQNCEGCLPLGTYPLASPLASLESAACDPEMCPAVP